MMRDEQSGGVGAEVHRFTRLSFDINITISCYQTNDERMSEKPYLLDGSKNCIDDSDFKSKLN